MVLKTLVCIGDSIVEGEGDEARRDGWVGRVRERLVYNGGKDSDGWQVYNLGVSGNTIRDVDLRMGEILARNPDIIILGCSTNDVISYPEKEGTCFRIAPAQKEKYWPLVLKKLKSICPHVLVNSGMMVNKDFLGQDGRGLRYQDFLNQEKYIHNLCQKMEIPYLSLTEDFNNNALRGHGLHWNAKGYEVLSDLMIKKLSTLGWVHG